MASKRSFPFELLADEVTKSLIQLVSVRGHGKSSSLRTIISHVHNMRDDVVFKIFDVSQSHYHCSSLPFRQHVTREAIRNRTIENLDNCVYEMGMLSEMERRAFVGMMIKEDYRERYAAKMRGELDKYPHLIFCFEEANVYFGSYSFRRNDDISPALMDFASVGRNYKMSGFLVDTAEYGEISPSLRRRVSRLYGRVESVSDIQALKRKDKEAAKTITKLKPYHFLFYNGEAHGPHRIMDEVKATPINRTQTTFGHIKPNIPRQLGYWTQIAIGFTLSVLIYLSMKII